MMASLKIMTVCLGLLAGTAAADTTRQCKLTSPSTSFALEVVGTHDSLVEAAVGESLELTLQGIPQETIPSGSKLDVNVHMTGVRVASFMEELGRRAAGNEFKVRVSHAIPKEMPLGKVVATVAVKTPAGKTWACLTVPIEFTHAVKKQAFFAVGSFFAPQRSHEDVMFLFNAWSKSWAKTFDAGKYIKAMAQFAENLVRVEAHNAQGKSWTMALNEFAHMGVDEWKAFTKGFQMPKKPISVPRVSQSLRGLKLGSPSAVDWVEQGGVNTPRNQGTCGSCWTFSATGAIEGAYFVANGNLPELSMQQLVECDETGSGCGGGDMDYAFEWLEGNGGQCAYADYPYTLAAASTAGSCQTTCTPVEGTTPSKYTDVGHTEDALMAAVAAQPVSIAIEADQDAFQFYSGGVMTGTCGTGLDHGVLAVGYGTDSDGGDYWKVKNSWGTTWGEEGYIRMQRGKDQDYGQCGILKEASYPTM